MKLVTQEQLIRLQADLGEIVIAEIEQSADLDFPYGELGDEWLVFKGISSCDAQQTFCYSVLSPFALSRQNHDTIVAAEAALVRDGISIPLDFDHVVEDSQPLCDTTQYIVMEDEEIVAMIARLQRVLDSRPKGDVRE